jgi:hypothetical protein
VVEAEGVPDGEDLLADLDVGARSDPDRHQLVLGGEDLQHREVLVGGLAHQRGFVDVLPEGHLRHVGSLDHVEVRDHVPLVVPHEAGARSLRHLEDVARPEIHLLGAGGDEHDGPGSPVEEGDHRLLVFGQVPAGGDRPGGGQAPAALGRDAEHAAGDEDPEHDAHQEAGEEG